MAAYGKCLKTGLNVKLAEYESIVRVDLFGFGDTFIINSYETEYPVREYPDMVAEFEMYNTFRVGNVMMAKVSDCKILSRELNDMFVQHTPEYAV